MGRAAVRGFVGRPHCAIADRREPAGRPRHRPVVEAQAALQALAAEPRNRSPPPGRTPALGDPLGDDIICWGYAHVGIGRLTRWPCRLARVAGGLVECGTARAARSVDREVTTARCRSRPGLRPAVPRLRRAFRRNLQQRSATATRPVALIGELTCLMRTGVLASILFSGAAGGDPAPRPAHKAIWAVSNSGRHRLFSGMILA